MEQWGREVVAAVGRTVNAQAACGPAWESNKARDAGGRLVPTTIWAHHPRLYTPASLHHPILAAKMGGGGGVELK